MKKIYFNPDRLHIINIVWSYPRYYDRHLTGFEEHPDAAKSGIYCISRVWGGKETIIYIGKTLRSFKKRMKEHLYKDESSWTKARGQYVLRIGTMAKEDYLNYEKFDKLVDDVESILIFEHQPKCNTDKKNGYKWTYDLRLLNSGYRGELKPEICNRDH